MDKITENPINDVHFGEDYKTFHGGAITLLIYLVVIITVV